MRGICISANPSLVRAAGAAAQLKSRSAAIALGPCGMFGKAA